MHRRDQRPLGAPSPLEDRMQRLHKHLEVCKQSLDASDMPELELKACATSTASNHESRNKWAVAASMSYTNAEGCDAGEWTPSCLSNKQNCSSLTTDNDGPVSLVAFDSDAPWSCRAVIRELPSPIRRTTEAFRLAQGLAV